MKNIFNSIVQKTKEVTQSFSTEMNDKMEDVNKTETPTSENLASTTIVSPEKFHQQFVESGKVLYLPNNFDFEKLLNNITAWLQNLKNCKTLLLQTEGINIVQYIENKGIKSSFGLSVTFHLYIKCVENKLFYNIRQSEWIDKSEDFSSEIKYHIGTFLKDSYENELSYLICEFVFEELHKKNKTTKIDFSNRYVEPMTNAEQSFFYSTQEEGEILLAFLEVSAVKKLVSKIEIDSKFSWRYMLTTNDSTLLAFTKNGLLAHVEELFDTPITVKREIGRDPVVAGENEWLSSRTNENLFFEIANSANLAGVLRLRETARQNWINNAKDNKSNLFAMNLLETLVEVSDNPFDELALLFVQLAEKDRTKVIINYITDEFLIEALKKILVYENTEEELIRWHDKWQISHIDSLALIQMFMQINFGSLDMRRILPFHRKVRHDYLLTNKDQISTIVFDIQYCKHLIICNETKEAVTILEQHLKNLPDESLSDLLPAENIDFTGKASGQVLRITILDLLTATLAKEQTNNYVTQTARLQPLVPQRLEALASMPDASVSERAKTLIALLQPEGLSFEKKTPTDVKINTLSPDLINNILQHPATRSGGVFSTLQMWLAEVPIPNYSIIKAYSERLSPTNFPLLMNIVADVKKAFGMEGIEVYISRGEKESGVESFEGAPSFLLVGVKHLEENSPFFLSATELQFAVGTELAHLYFKHSRITSNDVWKGAREKGLFVIDTVLQIVPVIGLLGNSMKNIARLSAIAAILQRTQRMGQITGKGKELVEMATAAANIYKTKNTAEGYDRQQELLAASRIMQLTADRAGLVLCGDLQAAIHSILICSKTYRNEFDVIKRYGIMDLILKQSTDSKYVHQDLAIRLAALCSFYLSEDYTVLRQKLLQG